MKARCAVALIGLAVVGVASDDPLIKDPIMPWFAAPPEVIDPPDRKIPYQPWAAAIGRRGVNFHKYLATPPISTAIPGLTIRVTEPGFELIEEACIEGERSMEEIRQQGGYRYFFGESWRFYR